MAFPLALPLAPSCLRARGRAVAFRVAFALCAPSPLLISPLAFNCTVWAQLLHPVAPVLLEGAYSGLGGLRLEEAVHDRVKGSEVGIAAHLGLILVELPDLLVLVLPHQPRELQVE